MNSEDPIDILRITLVKEFYTVRELVSLGLFGGKTNAYTEIRSGKLKAFFSSERRLLICREHILEYVQTNNNKKRKTNS